MYEETMSMLAAHGFEQYEVSNYARPGRSCRHNLGYWERRSYVSFGPSAHGFLRSAARQTRWANISNLTAYLGAVESGRLPEASREELTRVLILEELIFLGLRSSGIVLQEFHETAGFSLMDAAPAAIAMLANNGYAVHVGDRLKLTRAGYPFADRFALQLIEAVERAAPEVMARPVALPTLPVLAQTNA